MRIPMRSTRPLHRDAFRFGILLAILAPFAAACGGDTSSAVDLAVPEDLAAPDLRMPPDLGCEAGWVSCGGICRDVKTDPTSCGACGTKCAAGEVCSAGQCALYCQTTLTNCGGSCRDLQTDLAHCGACGAKCGAGEVCAAGRCELSCQTGLTNCGGSCRDLQTDLAHCGACGTKCGAGQVCAAGTCALSCPTGLTECGGACRDLQIDSGNCGACGAKCSAGQSCVRGVCDLVCAGGATRCGNACVSTATDPAHCGGCDKACAAGPNGTAVCVAGACSFVCAGAYRNCDGDDANGCETETAGNVMACGACGKACPGTIANGTPGCKSGACVAATCNQGYGDCDGAVTNGCEAVLATDAKNCGRCGTACPVQAPYCLAGTCQSILASCAAVKIANPAAADGTYTIDPDGPGPGAPFDAWCDMTYQGGGWTLLANYRVGYYHATHSIGKAQVTTPSGGSTPAPGWHPRPGADWGHLQYTAFEVAGRALQITCGSVSNPAQNRYVSSTLFTNWSGSEKGTYGASGSPGWGILAGSDEPNGARSNHYICGYLRNKDYWGIGYCNGPGASGSWSNHLASYSTYGPYGGTNGWIGCAGGTADALQVWLK